MVSSTVSKLRPTFTLRLDGQAGQEGARSIEVRAFRVLDALNSPLRVELRCAERLGSPAHLIGVRAELELSVAGVTRRFSGLISEVGSSADPADGTGSQLVVESALVALADRRRHRTLPSSTDLDLARQLLTEHGVEVLVSAPPNDRLLQRVQRDETDLELLRRVLRSAGCVLVHRPATEERSAFALEIADVTSLPRHPAAASGEVELGVCLRASRRSATYAASPSILEAGVLLGEQLVSCVRLHGTQDELQVEVELESLEDYRASAEDGGDASHPHGKPSEGNELVFQDKAGKELALLNAERDLRMVVKHNDDKVVGKNRSAQIKGNDAEHISGNKKASVLGQVMESVGGDALTSILGNLVSQVGHERILQTLGELASSAKAHRISSQEGTTFSVGQSMIHMTPELIILQAPKILVNPGADVGLEAALTGRVSGDDEG